jgi:HEPN domain-containing protein
VNRKHFQLLAAERIKDSQVLFENRRFDAAYYLAGYAVECALKACIAKQTKKYDFPKDRKYLEDVYTHDFMKLLNSAGLMLKLREEFRLNETLEKKWDVVKDWKEGSRYETHGRDKARDMIEAAGSPDGILECLKEYW